MKTVGNAPIGGPSSPDSGTLAAPRWTDKSFPFNRERQGVTLKPDFDFTRLGLLFPQNDPSEKTYFLDQMLHQKKFGTALKPHIHFLQEAAGIPIFKLDYKFYRNGDEVPAAWTTLSTADGTGPVFTFTANPILQIIPFPEIPAPANETASSHIDIIVYRDDDVVSGDILGKYFDYHFQKDGDGTTGEFSGK